MESSKFIASWQEIHTIVNDAMAKRDRSVIINILPSGGISVSVFPRAGKELTPSDATWYDEFG